MINPEWDREDFFIDFPEMNSYTGPIIQMPLPNKVNEIKIFFFDTIIMEIKKCLAGGSLIAALILCLASIDYLAGYYSGRKTIRDDYLDFLGLYFPKNYKQYNEFISNQLRCGLMHNLSVINPWKDECISFFIHNKLKPHLYKDKNDEGDLILYFSVPVFFEDIRRAFIEYAHQLIVKTDDNQKLVDNFDSRFNMLHGRGSIMVRTKNI